MKSFQLRRAGIAAAALAVAAAFASNAQADDYWFGNVLSPLSIQPAVSLSAPHFADLSVTQTGSVFDFTMSVLNTTATFGAGSFIGAMAVDLGAFAGNANSLAGTISNVSGGVADVDFSSGGGPTGIWEFRFKFGGGQDKLTNAETVSWSWAPGGQVGLSDLKGFAAHVQGVSTATGPLESKGEPVSSIWYSANAGQFGPTPVPEPQTYALMLAGLGLIGAMVRRRNAA